MLSIHWPFVIGRSNRSANSCFVPRRLGRTKSTMHQYSVKLFWRGYPVITMRLLRERKWVESVGEAKTLWKYENYCVESTAHVQRRFIFNDHKVVFCFNQPIILDLEENHPSQLGAHQGILILYDAQGLPPGNKNIICRTVSDKIIILCRTMSNKNLILCRTASNKNILCRTVSDKIILHSDHYTWVLTELVTLHVCTSSWFSWELGRCCCSRSWSCVPRRRRPSQDQDYRVPSGSLQPYKWWALST